MKIWKNCKRFICIFVALGMYNLTLATQLLLLLLASLQTKQTKLKGGFLLRYLLMLEIAMISSAYRILLTGYLQQINLNKDFPSFEIDRNNNI